MIALTWHDVDFSNLQIAINKSCVHGQIGETKTTASAKPVPLHPDVAQVLSDWQQVTEYKEGSDFLFPSIRANGQVPVWPDTLLQRSFDLRRSVQGFAERESAGIRSGIHSGRICGLLGWTSRSLKSYSGTPMRKSPLTCTPKPFRHKNGRRMRRSLRCSSLPEAKGGNLSTIQHHRERRRKRSRP